MLNAVRLAASMKSQWDLIQPVSSGLTLSEQALVEAARQQLCMAFAVAIVDEIVVNAVVNVASVTLVQTGTSSSGPGTGTVT